MNKQWTAVEHHRLHCVEEWPDSPYKQTVIAAIHARLWSLSRALHAAGEEWDCSVCSANRERTTCFRLTRKAA
jgi:hypothetical protein